MTNEEWLAACLADRPPLSQAQISALRPIWRPLIPAIAARKENAAPDDTGDRAHHRRNNTERHQT